MYPWQSWAVVNLIISTAFLDHHLFLYPVIAITSFLHLQPCQKTTDRGHHVSSGMGWLYLPETALTTELLCLRCLCEVESQHANVYLLSGLDPLLHAFNQTAVLCLFAISAAFMVTTHTGGQRGEPTSVSVEEDEWDSHAPEKWKRHIIYGAMSFCWGALSMRSWG